MKCAILVKFCLLLLITLNNPEHTFSEQFKPTCSCVATELLDFSPCAPLPACNSVVEGPSHQLLFIKLHCGAGVCLNSINALPSTHVP